MEKETPITITCSFCNKESILDKKIGKKNVHMCASCYAAFALT